jgi:hypothetical protein
MTSPIFGSVDAFKNLLRNQEVALARIWKRFDQYWTGMDPQQLVQTLQMEEDPRGRTWWTGLLPRLNAADLTPSTEEKANEIWIPYEIQMQILSHLEIHEADTLVRQVLPQLTPLWIPALPARFKQWFTATFSRDNMRYLGTTDRGHNRVWNLWRLRSFDLHPKITFWNQYAGINSKPVEAPALRDSHGHIMLLCLQLVAELEHQTESEMGYDFFETLWIVEGRDYLRYMNPLQRKGCLDCCEKVVENGRMAFILDLGCNACDRNSQKSHICDLLFLYKDELDVILANFKVVMKACNSRDMEIFRNALIPHYKHIGPAIAIQTYISEEGRCTALERCDAHVCKCGMREAEEGAVVK